MAQRWGPEREPASERGTEATGPAEVKLGRSVQITMFELDLIEKIVIWGIPILFAITVHEVAHGWIANKFGDPTAKMLGRLTLNPLKHIDPIGTIIVPGILLFIGGFIFGWAKPVPVTWQNLRNSKRDMPLVALAGPMANLLMAIIWALALKLGIYLNHHGSAAGIRLGLMGRAGISINLMLMVLNLIPIPPLDGSRVLSGFLPNRAAYHLNQLEPYGIFIILGLLASGILSHIISPIIIGLQTLFYNFIVL